MEQQVNNLPKNLIYLRKEKGLSQQQMADILGLNRGNIASYENGSAQPTALNLLKFVKYFNTKLEILLETDIESLESNENINNRKSGNIPYTDLLSWESYSKDSLEIAKGLLKFHKLKIDRVEEPSTEYLRLFSDFTDLVEHCSKLAAANIEFLHELRLAKSMVKQ